MRVMTKEQWQGSKREPLQQYADFSRRMERINWGVTTATANLEDPVLDQTSTKAGTMEAARLRGEFLLDQIIYSYSGGVSVSEISSYIPTAVEYWEYFAVKHVEFHQSPECDGHFVPHIDLYDLDYWEALQLVCFAILLGHPQLLGRIMEVLVYQNDDQDALLEALVAPYLPGRPGSAVYTRQLPYRKTKKIFEAAPDKRPALMAKYLDEWYDASRREPYYDRHKASYFPGYWSLEAAAITFVLDIDDSSYRDKPFYPKDLVDHARSVSVSPLAAPDQASGQPGAALRCVAGESCPRAGWWFTPARANSRRRFAQGEVMPDVGGDYGATIWQWDRVQDDGGA